MELFKIIGIGLLTCFLAMIIKQIKPEFYLVVLLSGGAIIILMLFNQFSNVINLQSNFENSLNKYSICSTYKSVK